MRLTTLPVTMVVAGGLLLSPSSRADDANELAAPLEQTLAVRKEIHAHLGSLDPKDAACFRKGLARGSYFQTLQMTNSAKKEGLLARARITALLRVLQPLAVHLQRYDLNPGYEPSAATQGAAKAFAKASLLSLPDAFQKYGTAYIGDMQKLYGRITCSGTPPEVQDEVPNPPACFLAGVTATDYASGVATDMDYVAAVRSCTGIRS